MAEVERCAAQGAVGIGELHPTTQGIDLLRDPGLDGLMELAHQRGMPVLVHGSEPVGHAYPGKGDTTPTTLMGFITRYPEATIVCAHWGGGLPFYGLMPEVRAALANTYFDTAATTFLYSQGVFALAAQALGTDHLLFGSDFPLVRPAKVARVAAASFEEAGLDGVALEALLHGNAARLLGRG